MMPPAKIFVAGHRGMVGSAIVRRLTAPSRQPSLRRGEGVNEPSSQRGEGATNPAEASPYSPSPQRGEDRGEGANTPPTYTIITRTHAELDLLDQAAVFAFLEQEKPDYVVIAAAKVGGIHANNTYRGQFIYENLVMEANLIHGAHRAGIQHLLFLGSSCIYPRNCPQPIKEEYLLTGPLEPTNEPYAIAKIAGIKLCESYNRQYGRQYISAMPTNLYGPGDNYDLQNSHVLPALIRKAHEAKLRGDSELVVWGSGTPRREFLYVDDLADACVFLMESGYDGSLINIGYGEDATIREAAETVMQVIGFKGNIRFDTTKPDGMPRKLLDVTRLAELGWRASTTLPDGLARAYGEFLQR
jgi:GDP-L-fucose synthase